MNFSSEEKARLIKEWSQSGQSAWAYAKEKGLVPQTFARWASERKKANGGFIRIHQRKITIPSVSVILIEKEDLKIKVPLATGVEDLKTIFKALGAIK